MRSRESPWQSRIDLVSISWLSHGYLAAISRQSHGNLSAPLPAKLRPSSLMAISKLPRLPPSSSHVPRSSSPDCTPRSRPEYTVPSRDQTGLPYAPRSSTAPDTSACSPAGTAGRAFSASRAASSAVSASLAEPPAKAAPQNQIRAEESRPVRPAPERRHRHRRSDLRRWRH